MGKAKRNNFLKGFLSVILTLAMVLPSLLTPAVAFADMITISGTEEHLTSYFVNFVQGNVELTASKFRARDSKGNTIYFSCIDQRNWGPKGAESMKVDDAFYAVQREDGRVEYSWLDTNKPVVANLPKNLRGNSATSLVMNNADNMALATGLTYALDLVHDGYITEDQMQFIRQVAVRAYTIARFGTEASVKSMRNMFTDRFQKVVMNTDSSGKGFVGEVKVKDPAYNYLLEYTIDIYNAMIDSYTSGSIVLVQNPTSVDLVADYVNRTATATITLSPKATYWEVNKLLETQLRADGVELDKWNGTSNDTITISNLPDNYTLDLQIDTFTNKSTGMQMVLAESGSGKNDVQVLIGVANVAPIETQLERLKLRPRKVGSAPSTELQYPEVPSLIFNGEKLDLEGGFDVDFSSPRGDGTLAAGFAVYIDGTYKTTFYANHNGKNASETVAVWDKSEVTGTVTSADSDCGYPLAVDYTAPSKTVTIREVTPEGYLTEPESGTGTGEQSWTVSYEAHADVTHPTHVTHEEDDGHGGTITVFDECPGSPDALTYEFTYKITPDSSFTSSDADRSQATVTFTNRIRKGQLLVVKEYEKDLDPFGDIPATKQPMPDALFTLMLTNGGSESCPYIRAVELGTGDPGYDPYYTTYKVVNDGSGTLYDGSSQAKCLKTSSHGYIKILDLPYGAYTLKEISSEIPGYVLETTAVTIADDTVYGPDTTEAYQSKRIVDYVIRNYVNIVKIDSETGKTVPAEGTSFRIRYMGNPNTPEADRPTDPNYGRYLTKPTGAGGTGYSYIFTTDANGKIELPYELQYGCYQLEEIVAPEGYYLGEYDTAGLGSDTDDSNDFAHTVNIYDASGNIVAFNVDLSDLPMTIHPFEVTKMGASPSESPTITIKAKNNSVKGKIEITKLGEELAGFGKTSTEYGDQYYPIYEDTLLNGAVFDIYAKSDILLPDGIDGPLFVDESGAAITLDTTLSQHSMVTNAQSIEEKVLPDGTELMTVTERYPDDPTAMAHSTLLTALDAPNKLDFTVTGTSLETDDTTYEVKTSFEHSPISNGYLNYDLIKKVTFEKIMGEPGYVTTIPEIMDVTTGTVRNTVADMHSDVFASDDVLVLSTEDSWDYVLKASDPLLLDLPMHYETLVSMDTRYVYTDYPSTGYYIAVWTDETHTEQTWIKVTDADARIAKLIRPNNVSPLEAIEGTYVIPVSYEIVDSTVDVLDPAITTPAGFTLDDVTYTDKFVWTDDGTGDPAYIACWLDALDHSKGMELAACDDTLTLINPYSNAIDDAEKDLKISAISLDGGTTFLDSALFTLDAAKAADPADPKFVWDDGAGTRLVLIEDPDDSSKTAVYYAYAGDMAFINIPDANPGYSLVPTWLKDQNTEGYNYIFYEDTVNGTYEIALEDASGNVTLESANAKGEYFSMAVETLKGQLISVGDNRGDIKLYFDGIEFETSSDQFGSTIKITQDGTVTDKILAETTEETVSGSEYSYALKTTRPSAYMRLNDGTLIGIIYSGGFTFCTIEVPYGNELPQLKIGGLLQVLDEDFIGQKLDPAHPKLNVLGTDASQTQIFSELQFDNVLLGTIEKTIITIAKKDDGKTFEFEMPDGREMTCDLVFDSASGTTRGKVSVECLTPTYRYLIGDLVDSITTGVDTEGLADTDGKAVSKLLPLGTYIVRERSSAAGQVITDDDYEVTLFYEGQYVPLVWRNLDFENDRVKLKVSLEKMFETSYDSGIYVNKEGAVFGLFADETITATTSTADPEWVTDSIEAGYLMGLMTVGPDGKAVEITDAPFGDYYVKELKTLEGYVLNDQKFPFTFDESAATSPTRFEDTAAGFTGEIAYRSEGMSEIRIYVLDQTPAVKMSVNGFTLLSDADQAYHLEGSASLEGKMVGDRYELTVIPTGDDEVIIEIAGRKLTFKQNSAAMSYELFAETPITVAAGSDAGTTSATKDIDGTSYTGALVNYKAGVETTSYRSELSSVYVKDRPYFELSNKAKVRYLIDTASGKNGGYVELPSGITVDTALTTETVPCADFTSDPSKVYVELATLAYSKIVLSDGCVIEFTKAGSDMEISIDESLVSSVKEGEDAILEGLSESGDIYKKAGTIKTITYRDRDLSMKDYLAAHGVSLTALKDNTRVNVTFDAIPTGLYIDAAAVAPALSTFLIPGQTLSATLASGITLDLIYMTDGTIEAGLQGKISGETVKASRATMFNHGGNFIDKAGAVIDTNAEGLYSESKDKVTLKYGENKAYRRADTGADVIEVKINAVSSAVKENEITAVLNKLPEPPKPPHYNPPSGGGEPWIKTLAKDGESGGKLVNPGAVITIIDTVSYRDLKKGKEYKVVGTLMDKETGLPYEVDGSPVTASAVFVAPSSSGTVDITFSFLDYSAAGKTLVVFEELYNSPDGDKPVSEHKDLNDTYQTIYVTKVQTIAGKTDDGFITDVVRYENLIPGKTYTLKGTLMSKESRTPVIKDGAPVTAERTFTAAASSGTLDLTFGLKQSELSEIAVVFEEVYLDGYLVAQHKDYSDEEQTVLPIKVSTTAGKTDDGFITDVVMYENLTPGKTYTLKGTLMSKKSHTPILKDGTPVTAETTFTPDASSGEVELTFGLKTEELREIAVVFEEIYLDGEFIAQHKDYEDEAQTVLPGYGYIELEYNPDEPGTGVVIKRPQTGYESYSEMLMDNMGMLMAALSVLVLILFTLKKKGLKVLSVILAFSFMFAPAFAFADGETITKETVFETLDENGETEIENTITTDDGLTYEVDEIKYEIIEKTPSRREVVTITGIKDKDSIKDVIEAVNDEGLEAEFDIIEFEETVRPKASATFTVLAGEAVPEKRTVTVSAGDESFSVDVLLKNKTLKTSTREKAITIPAKFWGNEQGYVIGGEIVSVSENSPCFSGYKTKILEVLGLDPALYTITGGSWNGPATEENGQLLRKATFTGTAKESYDYYSCYYEEDVTAPGRKFPVSYDARVTYSNGIPEGETQYTIKAVATYKKVVATYVNETTEQVTSFFTPLRVGAGIGGLAVITGAIVFAKKKKDEKDAAAYFSAAENGDLNK